MPNAGVLDKTLRNATKSPARIPPEAALRLERQKVARKLHYPIIGWGSALAHALAPHDIHDPIYDPDGMEKPGCWHWCLRRPCVPDRIEGFDYVGDTRTSAPHSIKNPLRDPNCQAPPRRWHRCFRSPSIRGRIVGFYRAEDSRVFTRGAASAPHGIQDLVHDPHGKETPTPIPSRQSSEWGAMLRGHRCPSCPHVPGAIIRFYRAERDAKLTPRTSHSSHGIQHPVHNPHDLTRPVRGH